jgi:hypothetical protein
MPRLPNGKIDTCPIIHLCWCTSGLHGTIENYLNQYHRTVLSWTQVPAKLVSVPVMPRLPNGKIDVKSLAEPEWGAGPIPMSHGTCKQYLNRLQNCSVLNAGACQAGERASYASTAKWQDRCQVPG